MEETKKSKKTVPKLDKAAREEREREAYRKWKDGFFPQMVEAQVSEVTQEEEIKKAS